MYDVRYYRVYNYINTVLVNHMLSLHACMLHKTPVWPAKTQALG